jgi:signal peptide peptidase SppA
MHPTLIHIAERALNRPLLLAPEKAQVILAVLAGRIGVGAPAASRFEGDPWQRDEGGAPVKAKPYNVKDGVGIITITGSLVARGAWIGASSGLTSYEGIQHQVKTAMADNAVRAVILDLHSPGGEATGAFETAALVRELAARKKTVAVVNGMAASAAYAIASGAGEIVTTETGVCGSIGVLYIHADMSQKLAKEGVKPTLIIAGARKADGNPFAPLPDGVKADFQREVDAVQTIFVTVVAAGRGARLTADQARATEARTFMGEAAVKAGLADRLGTFESVLAELAKAGTTTPRPAPASAARPSAAVAAARAAPVVAAKPDDPVTAARRAEWAASAALRGLWPDFAAYAGFCRDAETAALARRGTP